MIYSVKSYFYTSLWRTATLAIQSIKMSDQNKYFHKLITNYFWICRCEKLFITTLKREREIRTLHGLCSHEFAAKLTVKSTLPKIPKISYFLNLVILMTRSCSKSSWILNKADWKTFRVTGKTFLSSGGTYLLASKSSSLLE